MNSAKALLKANANPGILNDNNLTPYELANQYSNYELASQIKLQKEGKPIDKITWVLAVSDNEKKEVNITVEKTNDEQNFALKRVIRSRPSTMIENQFGINLNQNFTVDILRIFKNER